MIVYFIALFVVSIFGISFAKKGEWFDPLDKEQTSAINGISILTVFCCHILIILGQYGYEWNGLGDAGYLFARAHIGQLCVVSFLFYSGYGVAIQTLIKGDAYIKSFPVNRILTFYLNFAVSTAVLLLFYLVFSDGTSVGRILATFTCWPTIGDTPWYVVCILWCYISTWICLVISKKCNFSINYVGCGVFVFALIYSILLYPCKPDWWYNTIFAYSAGVFVAFNRKLIVGFLQKFWYVLLPVMFIIFLLWYKLPYKWFGIRHNIAVCMMMVVVLLLTMKVRINNPIIGWCGRHIFPIYIYHLIIFRIMRSLFNSQVTPLVAHAIILGVFGLTLLIAAFYHKFEISFKRTR